MCFYDFLEQLHKKRNNFPVELNIPGFDVNIAGLEVNIAGFGVNSAGGAWHTRLCPTRLG